MYRNPTPDPDLVPRQPKSIHSIRQIQLINRHCVALDEGRNSSVVDPLGIGSGRRTQRI
ncbi:hypothetical protein FA15DRAFT_665651 [Coprinopsis marcescibilis]|uniref:Uncharacterized protein n=1 Tax=Coprinopsis marcescibilis TaxID=230819 RepID=A0A5C3L560_COPMA|nr:hypothetical protein FA15DRAFT_665651 [Coprinopsis marcescibilis]